MRRLQIYLTGDYQIEHVGSTAISGMGGKGIIDMYIAVPENHLNETSKELQKAGYEFREKVSIVNKYLFHKIQLPDKLEDKRTYHVHLSFPEYEDFINVLAFRDYLRTQPQDLKRYAEVKQKAAKEAGEDKDKYMEIKSSIMQEILKKAKESL